MVEAKVVSRDGELIVDENGAEFRAAKWVIDRIAHLPMLADRILDNLQGEPTFVTPRGELLDQLDEAPSDTEVTVDDSLQTVLSLLARRPAGTASVVYLTSDAGEGKTTLITQLARTQAQHYKQKTADWLLVPVSLGGRTFMRFDDVIIGALVNRLRFPFLYYEAFLELVRLGVLVPAFDGFEEMFVEGSAGDAISALGNLVKGMQSSGSVLIAARKAYFEYKNLQSQTRLFDSLGGQSVSFGRLALLRWDKSKFLEYAGKRGVSNAEEIYQEVAARLSAEHPLLTRAVLVKRLLDVAGSLEDRKRLLDRIQADPSDYFRQFIGTLIQREAKEKWIDKVGELAQPLITEDEHYELLTSIALEMWLTNAEALRPEIFDFVAELFSDSRNKDKVITHQIIERLKQHALIVKADGGRLAFDHQEFYQFFLGEAIGQLVASGDKPAIAHAFRQGVLPLLTADTASRVLRRSGKPVAEVVNTVNEVCANEPRASFAKENLCGIVIRLLDYNHARGVTVASGSFPPNALVSRHLTGITFQECYFQTSSIENGKLTNCHFAQSEFEQLVLFPGVVENTILDRCNCRSVVPINSEVTTYTPQQVTQALLLAGFTFPVPPESGSAPPPPPDKEMILVTKLLRAFLRSTGVNEKTLYSRFGEQSTQFFDNVLPKLEDAGIIREVQYRGRGKQRRFELGQPLDRLNRSVEQCQGQLSLFIDHARVH
jgi:hypothetical protein